MSDEITLLPKDIEQILSFDKADIVIGIPSYNNADTIGSVVATARAALRQPLAGRRGVIINADGGSTDATVEQVMLDNALDAPVLRLTYPVLPGQKIAMSEHDVPNKARALKAILRAAEQLGAKVCVILAPNLRDVLPESLSALARPILDDGIDFVAPVYARPKFDGLVTTGIVYPLVRALYGKRIRQPMGSDFAVSGPFLSHCLAQGIWNNESLSLGIDLWMVTEAIHRGRRMCQARVGAMARTFRESSTDLSAALAQVLTTVFELMLRDVSIWQRPRGSESVPLVGFPQEGALAPSPLDSQKLIESFRLGYKNLQPVWGTVLPPATMLVLKKMASGQGGRFAFPDQAWVRTIFDFALGYRLRIMTRDHLLRAFTPLYLAWAASIVEELRDAGADAVERRFESLCLDFEREKPYLISRWRWPDRFNP